MAVVQINLNRHSTPKRAGEGGGGGWGWGGSQHGFAKYSVCAGSECVLENRRDCFVTSLIFVFVATSARTMSIRPRFLTIIIIIKMMMMMITKGRLACLYLLVMAVSLTNSFTHAYM